MLHRKKIIIFHFPEGSKELSQSVSEGSTKPTTTTVHPKAKIYRSREWRAFKVKARRGINLCVEIFAFFLSPPPLKKNIINICIIAERRWMEMEKNPHLSLNIRAPSTERTNSHFADTKSVPGGGYLGPPVSRLEE